MRHNDRLLLLTFLLFLTSPPGADADPFTAGLSTRIGWWTVEKREWAHWQPPLEWSASLLEEGSSPVGIMLGPQISLRRGRLFVDAQILWGGSRDFDVTVLTDRVDPVLEPSKVSGSVNRMYTSVDVMYGRNFSGIIGFRRLDVDVGEWESGQFEDHAISDLVIGFDLGGAFKREAWSARARGVFGIRGIIHMFDDERSVENPQVGEFIAHVDYHLRSIPIAIRLGYDVTVFIELDRAYEPPQPFSVDRLWEQYSNVSHGVVLSGIWSW